MLQIKSQILQHIIMYVSKLYMLILKKRFSVFLIDCLQSINEKVVISNMCLLHLIHS